MKRASSAAGPPRAPQRPSGEAERHLPHELPRPDPGRRRFTAADGEWLAWVAGRSVGGSGSYNLALIEAVHFARVERPDVAVSEALVGRGTFVDLEDAGLCALLATARVIPPAP